jgi:C4-dicarboxylate-specific signal transduction histidine kinase
MDAMSNIAPSRRNLAVSTQTAGTAAIELRITDGGPGLQGVEQTEAFQPFFTTKERGLGLGLSICSSIAKAHGGTLALANNKDGGATATLRLPQQHVAPKPPVSVS